MPCSRWAHLGVVASKGDKGERGRRRPISPARGFRGQLLRAKVRDGAARPPPHSPRPPARRQHSGGAVPGARLPAPRDCGRGLGSGGAGLSAQGGVLRCNRAAGPAGAQRALGPVPGVCSRRSRSASGAGLAPTCSAF